MLKNITNLFLAVMILFSVQAYAQVPVIWTNLANSSANDNLITKTGANGWNGSGHSTRKIFAGTGGSVEFEMQGNRSASMWGISDVSTTNSYQDIDFAFYILGPRLYLLENGQHVLNGSSIDVSNPDPYAKLRLDISPTGQVQYFYNDSLLYTSAKTMNADMFIDCAMYYTNTPMRANINNTPWVPVTWINLNNAVATGNLITEEISQATFANGQSTRKIIAGQGGKVKFDMQGKRLTSFWGLNDQSTTDYMTDIDFCFYVIGAKLYLLENGQHVGAGNPANPEVSNLDPYAELRFEISVVGEVKYFYNNTLLYTSTKTASADMFIDCTILTYLNGMEMRASIQQGIVIGGTNQRRGGTPDTVKLVQDFVEIAPYPNPAKDYVTVTLEDAENTAIDIINLQGIKLKTLGSFTNAQTKIYVGDLNEKMVILRIRRKGRVSTHKVFLSR